jgi:hypothetical protein
MRQVANNRDLWHPQPMTREVAQQEGWTFGII